MSDNEKLARKLRAVEKKYDGQFRIVFEAIREMMEPPDEEEKKSRIGFRAESGPFRAAFGAGGGASRFRKRGAGRGVPCA